MDLQNQIMRKLSDVIDPETGLNIVRMGLIQNLSIEEKKKEVHLVFRPTSFFCPLAQKLAEDIRNAVQEVADINAVRIKVEGYAQAKRLNLWLAQNEESRKAIGWEN